MKLSADEVTQIAKLARLQLTEQEVEKYRDQLSQILTYIEQLFEVKTDGVEPTAQVTGLTNALADDEVRADTDVQRRLELAPDRQDDYLKVPAVFGEPEESA